MSRVGKLAVSIPSGVNVTLGDAEIVVKGNKGELKQALTGDVIVEINDNEVQVNPRDKKNKRSRAMWGTTRALIQNMVTGVSDGFTRKLEINGVGFRASADKQYLTLALGYSHDIIYAIPDGVEIKCEKPTLISISGYDKKLIGQVAAEIRRLRKPEPYKGKGVRYEGEFVRQKEGKKK